MRTGVAIWILLTLTLLARVHAAQEQRATTVTLRHTVVLPAGSPATLGHVARLDGPQAQDLATVALDLDQLPADPAGWRRIDAQALRHAIERASAASDSPRWGALELGGGPCYVRWQAQEGQGPSTPPAGQQDQAAWQAPAVPGSVREAAEAHIARVFRVDPADVRVRWISASEGLLDHPIGNAVARIEDAGRSESMTLSITLYDAQARVVVEGQARAEVRIRRPVAVLVRDVARRRIIEPQDVQVQRRWLDPGQRPADPAAVVGLEAAQSLRAGQVVAASDVQASVAIHRGDRVQVRIITPSITASLWARALADGRPGEVIAFESLAPSRRDRLRFEARVQDAGLAVAVAGAMR
ncbi:MAG: hypothetical protein KatS3mg103_1444 [Phycisphaerales bacterium]|nr:MAG: hypothetical protein KatS3mg103_1444 [Phycisphaerales bacterium]